jgi:hypothetical protein
MEKITGEFRAAIIGGLKDLAKKGNPVSVRILMGNVLGQIGSAAPDVSGLLHDIREAIKDQPRCLDIWASSMCWEAASWNHAKFVAVDAGTLIAGGHNMWADVYLKRSPIFDISMRYDGPIAKGGHDFANGIWNFVARFPGSPRTFVNALNTKLEIVRTSPPSQHPQAQPVARGLPTMWVSNPGWGVFQKDGKDIIQSTMLIALYEALKTTSHVCISQQALASKRDYTMRGINYAILRPSGFPDPVMTGSDPDPGAPISTHYYHYRLIDGLADVILRSEQNKVDIVLSPRRNGYYNGEPEWQIFDMLGYRLHQRDTRHDKHYWVDRLNRQVRLRFPAVRYPDINGTIYERWRDSGQLMGNHAKFWMLDSKLFYVGSENLYPTMGFTVSSGSRVDASLQEFGVIAEADTTVSNMVLGEYFNLIRDFGVKREAAVKDLKWV